METRLYFSALFFAAVILPIQLFSQWQQLPAPASGLSSCYTPAKVPNEIIPCGFGRFIYSSFCKQSSLGAHQGNLLWSDDNLQSAVVKQSCSSSGTAGYFGLKAYNDSTFSWFQLGTSSTFPPAYVTFNSFKKVVSLNIDGTSITPMSDLTNNYFYSIVELPADTFYTIYTNLNPSARFYYKTKGYRHYSNDLDFVDDSTGFMIRTASSNSLVNVFIKTNNYGKNWLPAYTDSSGLLTNFYCTPSGDIYLIKKDGEILFSPDKGLTWTSKGSVPSSSCTTIHVQNTNSWLVGGQNGLLYKTMNGGGSWIAETSNTSEIIQKIYTFANEAYFVTANGNVFKSLSPVGIATTKADTAIKIFPNPSGGEFHVNVGSSRGFESSSLKLAVYDLYGKKVFEKTSSNEETVISLEEYPAGVYILLVENSQFQKRMKLQKAD